LESHRLSISFRSYRYKAQSSAEGEASRWRYLTQKYNYEMINQEPRIGLNGMWREEVQNVDKVGQTLVRSHGRLVKRNNHLWPTASSSADRKI